MTAAKHRGVPGDRQRATFRLWLTMAFGFGVFAPGCAPVALYDWGPYEASLQDSYIAHDDAKAYADLEATITSAQKTGHRIPPGACAEYGFFLYKRGQHERAIEYFQQEAKLFPESKALMDRLAAKVREQASAGNQPAEGGGVVQ